MCLSARSSSSLAVDNNLARVSYTFARCRIHACPSCYHPPPPLTPPNRLIILARLAHTILLPLLASITRLSRPPLLSILTLLALLVRLIRLSRLANLIRPPSDCTRLCDVLLLRRLPAHGVSCIPRAHDTGRNRSRPPIDLAPQTSDYRST